MLMSEALRIRSGSFGRVALLDMDRNLVRHAHPHCHVLLKVDGADTQFLVGETVAEVAPEPEPEVAPEPETEAPEPEAAPEPEPEAETSGDVRIEKFIEALQQKPSTLLQVQLMMKSIQLLLKEKNPKQHMTIDSVREFRELTEIKIRSKGSGLFMIGGGVPKNFIQDTVICAELLGKEVDMHKYAVQITVADSRDGACSSSTLKEASSWGKVDITKEQMVFAEATSVLPLIASDAYHRAEWKNRDRKNFTKIFE